MAKVIEVIGADTYFNLNLPVIESKHIIEILGTSLLPFSVSLFGITKKFVSNSFCELQICSKWPQLIKRDHQQDRYQVKWPFSRGWLAEEKNNCLLLDS